MAPINFPSSLDTATQFPTVANTDNLNTAGKEHSTVLHDNANAAILALEAKVGINSSTVTSSFDFLNKGNHADFTIYKSGSTYYARNERTATIDSSGSSLDVPFNAVTSALNNSQRYNNGNTGFWDNFSAGGVVKIARPSGGAVLTANAPLFVYTGQTIIGGGRGTIIQAAGSTTFQDPVGGTSIGESTGYGALISAGWGTSTADTALRVNLIDLTLDCNTKSNGILYRRDVAGTTINSGAAGMTTIRGCEVYNCKASGYAMQIGTTADAATQTGSSNTWISDCFIRKGGAGSKLFVNHTGDIHIEFCNFLQDRGTASYNMYLDELGVHVRTCHIGWQGSPVTNPTPNANVYVHSGGGMAFQNNYIDNAGGNSQAAIEIAGSNVLCIGNHINWSDSEVAAGKAAFYVVSGSGNSNYAFVGNRLNRSGATADSAPIVRVKEAATTTTMVGNRAVSTAKFWDDLSLGAEPSGHTGNLITSFAGLTQTDAGTGIITKAGIPTDADFLQPYNGIDVYDSTNVRRYVRVAGTWKYTALA